MASRKSKPELKFRQDYADKEYIKESEELDFPDQAATASVRKILDRRRTPRFKLEVDITITSRTAGVLNGYTVDISESGISAMLKIEVPLGEVVELKFTLPFGPVAIYAVVRQKDAFRYGFQFLESTLLQEAIRPTCRQLAMEQSLFGIHRSRSAL